MITWQQKKHTHEKTKGLKNFSAKRGLPAGKKAVVKLLNQMFQT